MELMLLWERLQTVAVPWGLLSHSIPVMPFYQWERHRGIQLGKARVATIPLQKCTLTVTSDKSVSTSDKSVSNSQRQDSKQLQHDTVTYDLYLFSHHLTRDST
jgi:hypothetical protein